MERYEAIVIGAGQAGVPLARELAGAGWRTALVERAHVGGTCYNEGCTPTKTMAASARVAYLVRRASDYGIVVGPLTVDMGAVRRRKRDLVENWRTGAEKRLRAAKGLDLIMGEATFVSPKAVSVRTPGGDELTLQAPRIFINTGARPRVPPLEGLGEVTYLTSTTVMDLEVVPDRLVILGGGYIAAEFGQMFRRFGSEVTIVHRGERLLSKEDADVSESLGEVFQEDGIELVFGAQVENVSVQEHDRVLLVIRGPEGRETVEGSHLLIATGRVPNSDTLELGAAGLSVDFQGYIPVNDRLETAVPGIYALGDVNGGPGFTHVSYDDYRVVRDNLLRGGDASTRGRLVPYTIFTDPQLGRVGLSETEARRRGLEIEVFKLPMNWVARALEIDESRGFIKVVTEADTGLILGCAVLGTEGGELMAILQMAMMGGVPAATLREMVFAHPTLAEALNNLFAAG